MDIKVLTSIPDLSDSRSDNKNFFVIGTHDGIFHCDEVVAIAILCLLHKDKNIIVVRTRNIEILNNCNLCVDIGGGMFDHHQLDFNLVRKNSIPYASAGLIWKIFGQKLVNNIATDTFGKMLNSSTFVNLTEKAYHKIDKYLISLVDAEDNGIDTENHIFSFISSFLPPWYNTEINFEEAFLNALDITIKILKQEIFQILGKVSANNILFSKWFENSFEKPDNIFMKNIFEIPCQNIPWLDTVLKINNSISAVKKNFIYFVIFPYPAGGWAAQCVPPSLERKFDQLISFPKEWAGQTENLPEISGVPGATFCHTGRFFARAKSKDDIINMCILAIKENNK